MAEVSPYCSLTTLPREVLVVHLLPLLGTRDPRDLCRLLATCRAMRSCADEPMLWHALYRVWAPEGYEAALGGVLGDEGRRWMGEGHVWRERFKAVYAARFVKVAVVSRYNNEYWCDVRGLVFSRTSLSVLFHVHGDNSLGWLQMPNASMLYRYRPADAPATPAPPPIAPAEPQPPADVGMDEDQQQAPEQEVNWIEDGQPPAPFESSGSENNEDDDDDEGVEDEAAPVQVWNLQDEIAPEDLATAEAVAGTARLRRASLVFPRLRNPARVPREAAVPALITLDTNRRESEIRGTIGYHAGFLRPGWSYLFAYGDNGYSSEHLFTLTSEFVAQHRLEHIMRATSHARRLSHVLDEREGFAHAQRHLHFRHADRVDV